MTQQSWRLSTSTLHGQLASLACTSTLSHASASYTTLFSPQQLRITPKTMRLTAELITSSLSYNNPLNERELDLRGMQNRKTLP